MRKLRIHLRHTGNSEFQFGVTRFSRLWGERESWGYNFTFGRWWLAVRDRNLDPEHYKPKRFFDLGFGRGQLKYHRMLDAATDEESYAYVNENPEHYRLEYFLERYRATKENQNDNT